MLTNFESEFNSKLEFLAHSQSYAFCYHCYKRIGKMGEQNIFCKTCGTDDLMRETDDGVEYGYEHVIDGFIRSLEPIDEKEIFDNFLDEIYEPVQIAGIEYSVSQILKDCDPIRYRVEMNDYFYNDEIFFEHNCKIYYKSDLEKFLEDKEYKDLWMKIRALPP